MSKVSFGGLSWDYECGNGEGKENIRDVSGACLVAPEISWMGKFRSTIEIFKADD